MSNPVDGCTITSTPITRVASGAAEQVTLEDERVDEREKSVDESNVRDVEGGTSHVALSAAADQQDQPRDQRRHIGGRPSGRESRQPQPRKSLWKSLQSWTPRERLMVTSMAIAEGTGFASLSIISPLYPRLAYSRGMSRALIGFVFSSFAIAAFVASPLFAFVTPRFGVRTPMIVGLVISGFSSIAFGLLDMVHNYFWFTIGSFFFRIMLGVMYAAYITSVFATVTTLFQHQMGLILSVVEIMVGLGISLGPALGSALFALGGYRLPFTAMGITQLVMTVPLFWLVPGKTEYLAIAAHHSARHGDADQEQVEKKSYWLLLVTWEPMLVLIIIGTIGIAFVYFHPILQPFLELMFDIKEDTAGAVFLAMVGSYCLGAPISGVVSDIIPHLMYYQMIVGILLAILGTLIVGPSPIFSWILPTSLVTTVAGLILMGTGYAVALIPTFHGFLTAIINAGYPSDVETFGLSSAFWNSAWALGEAIGPIISSTMVEAVGDYIVSFFVISAVLFALMLLIASHLLWLSVMAARREKRRKSHAAGQNSSSAVTSGVPTVKRSNDSVNSSLDDTSAYSDKT